jgi:hypothetical protein
VRALFFWIELCVAANRQARVRTTFPCLVAVQAPLISARIARCASPMLSAARGQPQYIPCGGTCSAAQTRSRGQQSKLRHGARNRRQFPLLKGWRSGQQPLRIRMPREASMVFPLPDSPTSPSDCAGAISKDTSFTGRIHPAAAGKSTLSLRTSSKLI